MSTATTTKRRTNPTLPGPVRADLANIGYIRRNVEALALRHPNNAPFVRAANLADRALRAMALRLGTGPEGGDH